MNNVSLIGNLTRDPELSYTPTTQTACCRFTIAVNRPKKDGQDQGADYPRIVVWGKQAENCDKYLQKGKKVAVKGQIRTGSYKNRNGETVYTTDVWGEQVEFLTSPGQSPQQAQPASAPAQAPAPQPEPEPQQMGFNDLPDSFSAADDDIPF